MKVDRIFSIKTEKAFETLAMEVFEYQFNNNMVYQEFCLHLKKTFDTVSSIDEIPFMPIEFFKSRKVVVGRAKHDIIFTSSGTGGQNSRHYVNDLEVYKQSYLKGMEYFYGDTSNYCILALLPSYLERRGSSLIYMMDDLIRKSTHAESGFHLDNLEALAAKLKKLDITGTKVLLIGVSFALLDLLEKHRFNLKNTIIMETGGMKGRRKELIRDELHAIFKDGFGVDQIHSEYGMTELLSQAYSKGDGLFQTPPWMQVQIRDPEDPFTKQTFGKTGGIDVIDLANINSCCFIATKDLGKAYEDGSFEVLGRFDNTDIRGCNLMVL